MFSIVYQYFKIMSCSKKLNKKVLNCCITFSCSLFYSPNFIIFTIGTNPVSVIVLITPVKIIELPLFFFVIWYINMIWISMMYSFVCINVKMF